MNVNYDRVCRLCLSSRGEILPIFPTTSSDDSEPPVLVTKIKDCVAVQINANDDLPTNVCKKCLDNVNNWHLFKGVCERSQDKLQTLIKKDGSQLEDEEVNIKSEPLSDEAYDDGVVIDGSYPDCEIASSANKLQPEGPPILASLGLTPRSDKNCVDPRMDWHRVHAILDMVQDSELIDSLQTTEECDVLHYSDHDSDPEAELQTDIDNAFLDCKNGYRCKNNTILSPKPKASITTCHVRVKEAMKLRKRKLCPLIECAQPKKAWQFLFTDDLLELIASSTNENIVKRGGSEQTDVSEIKKFIGILYLHGIMRPTHQKCSDLWNNECGASCVKNAMKYERFKYLLKHISFDHEEDNSIIQLDIMKRFRKVFELFAMNSRTAFVIENTAVIDEIIVPVYGPCPFRYDIDKKQLKRGIKMFLLVDASNFYVSNIDIITDPCFAAEDIVKKMAQHLAGTGKIIVMNCWYYTKSLMDTLLREYQLFTIASLNPHNENIPPLFLSQYRKDRVYMSAFLDSEVTLISYVDSKSKVLNIVTNEPKFYKKGPLTRSTLVSAYKRDHSAVEVVDVVMHYYTTMQHTNDWTLSLFFTLLNIASVNAQVIWSSHNSYNMVQRRLFIKDLALSLLDNDISVTSFDVPEGKRYREMSSRIVPYYKSRRRCRICIKTTKKDRRTKQYCAKCSQFICKEHSVNICTTCVI